MTPATVWQSSAQTRTARWVVVVLALVVSLPAMPAAAQVPAFNAPAFEQAWRRTEAPVAAGRVNRPWLWGAVPLAALNERFDDAAPGKQRPVLYFDKGRMDVGPSEPGGASQVQSGALVRDLALGLVQVGSNQTMLYDPAFLPVAGDDGPGDNLAAPRYADFALEIVTGIVQRIGLPPVPSAVGKPIVATIQAGARGERAGDAEPRVLIGAYDDTSNHNIAAPFWEAFAASGLVVDPVTGADQQAPLYDWRTLVGAPLSEPAWTQVVVSGTPTWVVVQLFERRVLTYRPDAPAGWRVEMGNVGRHAHRWRYGPAPTLAPMVGLAPATKGVASQRVTTPPLTPTTAIVADTTVPASVNGAVLPGAAAGGVRQIALARGFRTITFIDDGVSVWLTSPSGETIDLNGDGPAPVRILDETADGVILGIDTIRMTAGVWAMTMQAYRDGGRQSIIFFRVLPGPREAALSLLLNPLFWLGLTGDGAPTMLTHAWQEATP